MAAFLGYYLKSWLYPQEDWLGSQKGPQKRFHNVLEEAGKKVIETAA